MLDTSVDLSGTQLYAHKKGFVWLSGLQEHSSSTFHNLGTGYGLLANFAVDTSTSRFPCRMLPLQFGKFGVGIMDSQPQRCHLSNLKHRKEQAGLALFVLLNFISSSSPRPKINILQYLYQGSNQCPLCTLMHCTNFTGKMLQEEC